MRGALKILVICFAGVVTLAGVFISNAYLSGEIVGVTGQQDPGVIHVAKPEDVEKYIHHLDAILTSVDQTVSLLVAIQLSLFVLAGFALNTRPTEAQSFSITLIIFGGLFMLTALMSLTLGYTARIQAMDLVRWGASDFQSVHDTVVSESRFVVFSGVAAMCMMLTVLLDRIGDGVMIQPKALAAGSAGQRQEQAKGGPLAEAHAQKSTASQKKSTSSRSKGKE